MHSALDAGYPIRVWKKGAEYCAAVDGLAIFGCGESRETAVLEVDRRFAELSAFCERSGLALSTLAPDPGPTRARWGSALGKTALVFACCALLMIPFSYALSTGLQRGLGALSLRGGHDFWSGIEQSLIKTAHDAGSRSPQEHAETLAALRTIVGQAKPYTDEIRPLFGCGEAR